MRTLKEQKECKLYGRDAASDPGLRRDKRKTEERGSFAFPSTKDELRGIMGRRDWRQRDGAGWLRTDVVWPFLRAVPAFATKRAIQKRLPLFPHARRPEF